jgi:hypothetical protein
MPLMGIALWIAAAAAAYLLARIIPSGRGTARAGEAAISLAAALVLGAVATALDFGGWSEPDWRAGLFTLFGALAAIGTFRFIMAPPPGGPS